MIYISSIVTFLLCLSTIIYFSKSKKTLAYSVIVYLDDTEFILEMYVFMVIELSGEKRRDIYVDGKDSPSICRRYRKYKGKTRSKH